MRLVVDASVAVKWFYRDDEADVGLALGLLRDVRAGRVRLFAPPHFLAEVAAVLARESPETADDNLRDLLAVPVEVRSDAHVYARATRLAIELDHHLFDTLYHAVAIETPEARLVTADQRYRRKALRLGDARLCTLADLRPLQ